MSAETKKKMTVVLIHCDFEKKVTQTKGEKGRMTRQRWRNV